MKSDKCALTVLVFWEEDELLIKNKSIWLGFQILSNSFSLREMFVFISIKKAF